MSLTWELGSYDNDSKQSEATLKFQRLHLKTDYGKDVIGKDENLYKNDTSSRMQPEYITLRSKELSQVNSPIKVTNPAQFKAGMQATIQIDTLAISTDSVTGTVTEYPLKSYLTINVPNAVPDTIVEELVNRQISACFNDSFDECRFVALLKGIEDIKED